MKPIDINSEKSNDLNENQDHDENIVSITTIQPFFGIDQPSEEDTQDTLPVRVNFNFEDNNTGSTDGKISVPSTEQQQHGNDKVNNSIMKIDNSQNGKDNDRNNNLITSTTIL